MAKRTDTVEPYVTEWLNAGASGGYVTYVPETGRYSLTPEQAALLADEDSPAFLAGHNYPSFPIVGIVAFTIACTTMAPVYTYIVVRSKSVLPAAIFYGVFNPAGLVGYAATDDVVLRQLVASEGGIIGIMVFGLIALAIAITGSPRLTRDFTHNTASGPADAQRGEAAATAMTVTNR